MALLLLVSVLLTGTAYAGESGILLFAHGGNPDWNARVTGLAKRVDRTRPTEVAFGMADRETLQAAIGRLVARGVTEIVAVPLFVSSWSSVITSTEYLLGLRREAPSDLATLAAMSHSRAGAKPDQGASAGHQTHTAADAMLPVTSPVPIRMTRAFNDHPIIADILASRAGTVSRNQAEEAVVIVAHGPNADEENRRWLADMASLAARIRTTQRFASVDYLTLRDDAPKPVRDRATADLRALVARRRAEGRRIIIAPLLVSFGGIERGLRERLEGLPYAMPGAALVPDDRLVGWVLAMAAERTSTSELTK